VSTALVAVPQSEQQMNNFKCHLRDISVASGIPDVTEITYVFESLHHPKLGGASRYQLAIRGGGTQNDDGEIVYP
jgi:hypothetical protein